jgi:predicted tellurium resistance membrane protein TerC
MTWVFISDTLVSLTILTFLEIVLGVDNLIFISIICNRLPLDQQKLARRVGLGLALITRLLLLASVLWLIGLTKPLFTIAGTGFSGRDLFLIAGGLFLLYKSTLEIHTEVQGGEETAVKKKFARFGIVVTQIAILDIVFSLDSIFTAVGLTQTFWIMATAITIAIILMIVASEPLSRFVQRLPTIKMLALSFLLMIGTMLIADGFHFHVPREYIYFALTFSIVVEALNMLAARKRKRKREAAY